MIGFVADIDTHHNCRQYAEILATEALVGMKGNFDFFDWGMDLLSKTLMAIFIGVSAWLSAQYIEKGIQVDLANYRSALEQNREQNANIKDAATQFLDLAYKYATAMEAAYNDILYRHDKYHANSKGINQQRYELELYPLVYAAKDKLIFLCSKTKGPVDKLWSLANFVFEEYYNPLENLPPTQIIVTPPGSTGGMDRADWNRHEPNLDKVKNAANAIRNYSLEAAQKAQECIQVNIDRS